MTILHFNDVYNVEGRVKDRATDELFLFFFCFWGVSWVMYKHHAKRAISTSVLTVLLIEVSIGGAAKEACLRPLR